FHANKLVLEGSKGDQLVLYYFETGSLKTVSYGKMRLSLFRNRLLGKQQGCALVRFSLTRGEYPAQDLADLKDFAAEIAAILPAYLL
ncbi:MAG: exosortase-associated EpsI family protein, partial [Endomicrobiales bacterium]